MIDAVRRRCWDGYGTAAWCPKARRWDLLLATCLAHTTAETWAVLKAMVAKRRGDP